MDERLDPDAFIRLRVCEWVNYMAERNHCSGETMITSPDQLIQAAQYLEGYVQNGETTHIHCPDGLARFVRCHE